MAETTRSSEDDYDSAFVENGENGKDLTPIKSKFCPDHVWPLFKINSLILIT